MSTIAWLFDGLLVAALLYLAWSLLSEQDLFKAVVLFIAFGLLMALSWTRLQAPDIALAEAVISAGLSGVLLLDAVGYVQGEKRPASTQSEAVKARRIEPVRTGLNLLALLFCAALIWAVLDLPPLDSGLSSIVQAQMGSAGVTSQITAVLLNFRGYDTLLEVAVLVLAAIGCLTLREADQSAAAAHLREPGMQVLDGMIQLVIPVMLLVSGYLLWAGEHAPGGAFQTGAMLGAAGFLLLLGNRMHFQQIPGWLLRISASLGLSIFLLVAGGIAISGRSLLEYPVSNAGKLIVLLETAISISIGSILIILFAANPPSASSPTIDQATPSEDTTEIGSK
ncbi:MAG: DUF4040 domain-containing protein [Desulforhabdus sp.]|jgi:multisubunit Na+/H+ antiporter MnhB subunit|nr:DUF4040 domain-containing protein [Desulforhabdus sp.]